jgi:hypothetical protein
MLLPSVHLQIDFIIYEKLIAAAIQNDQIKDNLPEKDKIANIICEMQRYKKLLIYPIVKQ